MIKHRILIVDDEELERDSLEYLLSDESYLLFFAENGETALQRAQEIKPDLILLDVIMPGIDGFEVCRRLRMDSLVCEVPIILITSLDDPKARIQGLEAGADDFVSKPFQPLELRARVRSVTRLNRYRRLLAERSKFAWVVEHSKDAYLLLDSRMRIVYANAQAKNYLYLNETEIQESLPEFLACTAPYYKRVPEVAWHYWPVPGGDYAGASRYLVRPEGQNERILWLEVECFRLPSELEDNQLLVRLLDATGRITQQQQTWSFHRLLAHKLRTPLMGNSLLEMLRYRLVELGEEKLVQVADMALNSARRQERQLSELLRYVDTPSLLPRYEYEAFFLDQSQELAGKLAQELELELEMQLAGGLDKCFIPFSPIGFEVILRELFSNAQKFHPRRQPQIDLALATDAAGMLVLQCTDDGCHLPAEELEKVWMPYYQVEKSFTGEVEGMGLGLSTVASLVWQVGGQCRLYNRTEREGIVAQLTLPCKYGDPAAAFSISR